MKSPGEMPHVNERIAYQVVPDCVESKEEIYVLFYLYYVTHEEKKKERKRGSNLFHAIALSIALSSAAM